MVWCNCCFWAEKGMEFGDIDPRRFSWWCGECNMAIKDCNIRKCPECGGELTDISVEIDIYEELHSGIVNGLSQDEEGNWGYD